MRSLTLTVAIFLYFFSPPVQAQEESDPHALRVLTDRPLSSALQRSRDVRWASGSQIHLAVLGVGVVRVPVAVDDPVLIRETVDGDGSPGSSYTSRLAVTPDYLVFASELFLYGWKKQGVAGVQHTSSFFEGIEDLDAFEDRYAILGLHREGRQFAPDGTIAWQGQLGPEFTPPRPLLTSLSGPGAQTMLNCPTFGIGAVRFLPDGSLLVVPGSESGAYLYHPSGRLLATWDTKALGIGADCSFSDEQSALLSGDPHARWAYLNRYRTVDEILVLGKVPTLAVRRVEGGKTRWELIALKPYGKISRRDLPVSAPSQLVHLRSDTRDDHTVLLLFDEATLLPPTDPVHQQAQPTRLVMLESARD